MIEPEIAFCDLQGDMKCAEEYVNVATNRLGLSDMSSFRSVLYGPCALELQLVVDVLSS
jgi:hypothetical protein